jgi:antitoxin YefM
MAQETRTGGRQPGRLPGRVNHELFEPLPNDELHAWEGRAGGGPRRRGDVDGDARGTIVPMATESLRTVRDRLSEFVDRVQRHHDRVTITRNGARAAVLISPEDLDSLEETLEILADTEAVRELRQAERAVAGGDVVRGVEAVRRLRGG